MQQRGWRREGVAGRGAGCSRGDGTWDAVVLLRHLPFCLPTHPTGVLSRCRSDDPLFMAQIISSAIMNAPPGHQVVKMLLRTNWARECCPRVGGGRSRGAGVGEPCWQPSVPVCAAPPGRDCCSRARAAQRLRAGAAALAVSEQRARCPSMPTPRQGGCTHKRKDGARLLPHAPAHRQADCPAQLVSLGRRGSGVAKRCTNALTSFCAKLPCVPQVRRLAGGAALCAAHGAARPQLWRPALPDARGKHRPQVGRGGARRLPAHGQPGPCRGRRRVHPSVSAPAPLPSLPGPAGVAARRKSTLSSCPATRPRPGPWWRLARCRATRRGRCCRRRWRCPRGGGRRARRRAWPRSAAGGRR